MTSGWLAWFLRCCATGWHRLTRWWQQSRTDRHAGPFVPPIYVLALWSLLSGCAPCCDAGTDERVVQLGYFPNVTHGVALVGTGRGLFARALGADVRLKERVFAAGPSAVEALFAGQLDIGYIGPGPAVNGFLKSRGRALRIVAGAASGGAGLVAREDAGIASIADLAGRRVVVPQIGGTQDVALRHALGAAGLRATDRGGNVTVIGAAPSDALALFLRREVDAAWVVEPWVSRLIREGRGRLVLDERALWPEGRFSTVCVVMRTGFLEKHPDLARRFLQAHVETARWIEGHRSAAGNVIRERIRQLTGKGLPEGVVRDALNRIVFTTDPLQGTVLETARRAQALGYLREDLNLLENLFDLQPLAEAEKQVARHR
ncbi:MAG: ABC transporter substrate-binding protein [Chloroherpetonaceae bacterium]|nr:ABC transporter substrate-binding protein [Chthonomonadaceae bacterium]MDW8206767.1 ABC transporter substrate-binding protein [Chloroherpetonaceae bacterium]